MRAIAATIFALLCTPAFAQSAAFDAADVHPSAHRANPFPDGGFLRGDRYVYRQATMVDIIAAAYNMDAGKVLGGPSWLEADRFDIIAKAPSTTPPETVRLMLQSLLADRFKLVFHHGDQAQPAFVLSAGKGKPKLKQSEGDGDSNCENKTPPSDPGSTEIPTIIVSCRYMSMEDFATALRNMAGGYLSNPVVDSTNLKGTWDFDLKWTPRGLLQRAGADGISIFDAVDKQLGLKLDLQTATRPAFIVDSVDRMPTPNAPNLAQKLPPAPPAQFDVATVKPSKPDAAFNGKITGGLLDVTGAPLKFVIAYAWNLNPNSSEVPANAPKWLDTEKFDITAKVLNVAPTSGPKNTPAMDDLELREMIQSFLVDRFKMQSHIESRPITAYTLTAVNPRLRPANPESRTRCTEGPGPDGKDPRNTSTVLNRLVTCQNMTLAQIGDELQNLAPGYIYNQVLDATNIPGSWDFTLSFSSADQIKAAAASSDNGASDPNGALSIFDAVSKQLGLKLEKQKRPVPILVIDHIEEKPTDN